MAPQATGLTQAAQGTAQAGGTTADFIGQQAQAAATGTLSGQEKWLLAYGALFFVLLIAAETDTLGGIAAALAALVAGSATFVLLPTSLRNMGLLK